MVRDRRIKVERFSSTVDEANEQVKVWSELAIIWASKRDISDRERMASMELSAEVTTRFVILHSAALGDLNAKDRVEYPIGSGVYFDIFSVKELGRREGFEISAAMRSDLPE